MSNSAPPVTLDAIEQHLLELLPPPPLPPVPAKRGRPEVLPLALLWLAILVCLLHRVPTQRAVWRQLHLLGLWHYPRISIGAEGVRKRMLTSDPAGMEALFTQVTARVQAEIPGDPTLIPWASGVYAMDATILDRVVQTVTTPTGAACPLAGRVDTLFDLRRQCFTAAIPSPHPHQNERVAAPALLATLPPGSVVTMDRGYLSYALFDHLTDAGQTFITRVGRGMSVEELHVFTATATVHDRLVWVGRHRADRCAHRYRLIAVTRADGTVWTFLTNDLDPHHLSAAMVADCYQRRWDIELGFKALKQELGLRLIWSTRWELNRLQVWATLIIAQIAVWARGCLAQRAGVPVTHVSMALLVQILPHLVARGDPDPLADLARIGTAGGLIRPPRRTPVPVPVALPITPPPPDLPTTRTPRYARKP